MANIICCVCGKEYKYCGNCDKSASKHTWKTSFCSENCRDIFRTCSGFEGGMIDLDKAFDTLNSLNIEFPLKKSVAPSVKKILDEGVKIMPTKEEEIKHKRGRRRRSQDDE